MIILGIDPGSRRVGYGIIENGSSPKFLAAGILKIKSVDDVGALRETEHGLAALIKEWHPEILAIEKLFFSKNQKTALHVAEARGVVLATCARDGLLVKEYAPNEVKSGITGYGFADKKAVAKMVRLILRAPGIDCIDDAMDALAIALFAGSDRTLGAKDSR